jgi:hypothetical protein
VLLQLGLYVLCHQVYGNNVVALLPGNDDVSKPAASYDVMSIAVVEDTVWQQEPTHQQRES